MHNLDQVLSKLHHPNHIRLYQYWSSKSPPGRLPGRQNLDPLEIPDLLFNLALIDIVRANGECRFRYRLAGTGIAFRAERDPTGKFFEELYDGEYLQKANSTYQSIVQTGLPFMSRRQFPVGEEYLSYDRLVLPLASDGETVDMLVFLPVFLN
jgi:hypothetical protein